MNKEKKSRYIGRKIWYTIAIILCVLVILLGVVSVVGTWVIDLTLSDVTVTLLGVVDNTAGQLRNVASKINQGLAQAQEVTTSIAGVTGQLSENIQDKGIILTLLPEEQEQKLVGAVNSVQDAFTSVQEVLLNGIKLYRSIDQMPFVDLPKLNTEQVDKIEASMTEIQATTSQLQGDIQQVRDGAAEAVGRVESGVNKITQRMGETRDNLAELDVKLAALQELMVKLQKIIPTVFILLAVLTTLFAAFIIYTQVEVISLFVRRWRSLGKAPLAVVENPPPAPETQSETPVEPPLVHDAPTEGPPAGAPETPETQ
jgi:hypothetical protein